MRSILAAAAFFLALAGQVTADPTVIEGPARVIDGDSLKINGVSIRLEGIDAPEMRQTCDDNGRVWKCGLVSASNLRGLIAKRPVRCESQALDKYRRALATCFVGDLNLNQAQVQDGWALAYRRYSERYVAEEGAAKIKRLGIWTGQFEVPEAARCKSNACLP